MQQLRSVVHEHLRRDDLALRLFRLVLKARHPALLVNMYVAEATRPLYRHRGGHERHVSLRFLVAGDRLPVVELVDVVRAHHNDDVGGVPADSSTLMVDGIRVALVPAFLLATLLRREQLEPTVRAIQVPRPPSRKVLVQRVWLVLFDYPHVGEAAVHAVAQGEVNEAVQSPVWDRRLCPHLRQGAHPAACPAGHYQCQYLFPCHAFSSACAVAY